MNDFHKSILVYAFAVLAAGSACAQTSTQESPYSPVVGGPTVELRSKPMTNAEYQRSRAVRWATVRANSKHTLVIRDALGVTVPADSRARNVQVFTEIERSTVLVMPAEAERRQVGATAIATPPDSD